MLANRSRCFNSYLFHVDHPLSCIYFPAYPLYVYLHELPYIQFLPRYFPFPMSFKDENGPRATLADRSNNAKQMQIKCKTNAHKSSNKQKRKQMHTKIVRNKNKNKYTQKSSNKLKQKQIHTKVVTNKSKRQMHTKVVINKNKHKCTQN